MAFWDLFKKQDSPSLPSSRKRDEIDEIFDYWKKSSKKACGNCTHFGYAAGAGPKDGLCHVSGGRPDNVQPTDFCVQWQRRTSGW